MENIIGTWALLRTEAVDANGKPTSVAPFGGANFIGRVVFTKEGRMSAAITDAREQIPEGETREYSCYAGAYIFEKEHKFISRHSIYSPRSPINLAFITLSGLEDRRSLTSDMATFFSPARIPASTIVHSIRSRWAILPPMRHRDP